MTTKEQALAIFKNLEELLVNFATDVCMGQEHLYIDWQKVMDEDFSLRDLETLRTYIEAQPRPYIYDEKTGELKQMGPKEVDVETLKAEVYMHLRSGIDYPEMIAVYNQEAAIWNNCLDYIKSKGYRIVEG